MNRDEFYEEYHEKGGTYEIPAEIFHDLLGELEEKEQEKENLIKYLEKTSQSLEEDSRIACPLDNLILVSANEILKEILKKIKGE